MKKNLVLVVNAAVVQVLTEKLRELDVGSFIVSHVEGHGVGADAFLTVRDRVVGYVPRARVDLLLLDEEAVDRVLRALAVHKVEIGRGIWWVVSLERHGSF